MTRHEFTRATIAALVGILLTGVALATWSLFQIYGRR